MSKRVKPRPNLTARMSKRQREGFDRERGGRKLSYANPAHHEELERLALKWLMREK